VLPVSIGATLTSYKRYCHCRWLARLTQLSCILLTIRSASTPFVTTTIAKLAMVATNIITASIRTTKIIVKTSIMLVAIILQNGCTCFEEAAQQLLIVLRAPPSLV